MQKNDSRSFSVKVGEEWINAGWVGKNLYDANKTTVTINVTKGLKDLINSKQDGEKIYCNLYQPKSNAPAAAPTQHQQQKQNGYITAELDDSVPF